MGSGYGKFFMSALVNMMIIKGLQVKAILINNCDIVSKPVQLATFTEKVSQGYTYALRKRFCFDLDGTLFTHPLVPGDYTTVKPLEHNIELVKSLYRKGHTIIISSSRGMVSTASTGEAVANNGMLTFQQLKDHGVQFHEIYFGRPAADVYIGESYINSSMDTAREIGWTGQDLLRSELNNVVARHFNAVTATDDVIVKSGPPDIMKGEIYYYKNVPDVISDLIPKMYESFETDERCTMTMAKIDATTMSKLYISRCLTKKKLRFALSSLKRLHDVTPEEAGRDIPELDLNKIYAKKIIDRYVVPTLHMFSVIN